MLQFKVNAIFQALQHIEVVPNHFRVVFKWFFAHLFVQNLFLKHPRMIPGTFCSTLQWPTIDSRQEPATTSSSRSTFTLSKVARLRINTHLNTAHLIVCLVFFFPQDYEKALKYIRTLLRNEPGNKQALDLEKLIDKALKKGQSLSESQQKWITWLKPVKRER